MDLWPVCWKPVEKASNKWDLQTYNPLWRGVQPVARYEVEKFTRNGDFLLWMRRIKAVFASQKALKSHWVTLSEIEKQNMEEATLGTLASFEHFR